MTKQEEYDTCVDLVLCLVRKLTYWRYNAGGGIALKRRSAWVQDTYQPGMTLSQVARAHGIAPGLLFRVRACWCQAVAADEAVVPASEYQEAQRADQGTAETAGEEEPRSRDPEGSCGDRPRKIVLVALSVIDGERRPVAAVCRALGISRNNVACCQSGRAWLD